MYTLLELESKTFGELRKIGRELNVLPEGDRRRRQTWIEAIAGVNPPLLQLLEVSAAVEVQAQEPPIIETVETSPGVEVDPVFSAPLKSKFGRIVYPRSSQGAIAPAAKTSPGVDVDLGQEPIVQAGPYSPGVDVDYIEMQLQETLLEVSPGACDCPFCGAQHGLFIDRGHMDRFVIRCLHCAYSRLKTYPGAIRTLAQESVLSSKSGGTSCKLTAKPIAQNEEARPHIDRTESADIYNWRSPSTKSDTDSSGARTEALGSQEGDRVLAVARHGETGRESVLPDRSTKLVNFTKAERLENEPKMSQSAIAQAAAPPGVEVDRVEDKLPECPECFDDGYFEDESGFLKLCHCNPKLSCQKTQSAIAPAANISLNSESDLNPILTGIPLSDRFVARYSPPQPEIEFNVDTDGQLSLLDFKVKADEAPDPDDFESLDAFRDAIARWDREHPNSFDHCSDHCSDLLPSSVHCLPSS